MLSVVLLCAVAAAPPPPRPLPPKFDSSFPGQAKADLAVLAADTIACCRELWPGAPPAGERPIVLYHRAAGPLTDATSDPKTYRIYLSVTERYYSQFVYQLAHEFAHVMLDPRRTNGLIETLAVAFSLEALDAMTRRWKVKAPYPNWKGYAPEFAKYRRLTEKSHLDRFPLGVQVMVERKSYDDLGLYLRHRRAKLENDAGERDLQHLASIAILAKGVRWRDLTGVAGQTDPPPSKDGRFRGDLPFAKGKMPALFRVAGCGRKSDLVTMEFDARPTVKGGLVLREGPRRWLWIYEQDRIDAEALEKAVREYKPTALRWERGK
jgi:hypothetical protein